MTSDFSLTLKRRMRRLRANESIRSLVREYELQRSDFVNPLFTGAHLREREAIASMPGIYRLPPDDLLRECEASLELGIKAVALFEVCPDKTEHGEAALNPEGHIPKSLRAIKERFPELVVISDIALDPYTSHGHDGLVKKGEVVNDPSVKVLREMALLHAQAGADFVAPSDMMDGRVGAIRNYLDAHSYENTGIIAYSAKYASSFYGPFREALASAPKKGDKKSYQMDYANAEEALAEVALDIDEGADMVMVKPALSYLDIISQVKNEFKVPVAAYNVSGEYSLIKAAAERGWVQENALVLETLTSIKRAGADVIFTYWAKQAAQLL